MTKNKKTIIQRLSLIKYLYTLGLNQSYNSELLSGISILFFHDSIELFLQISAEEIGVKKEGKSFMGCWKLFEDNGKKLSYEENMDKLNRARVSLKHHGLLPSRQDIENFRISVSAFLEESYKLIFNIEFKCISLIDYIGFENTKKYLKIAEKKFGEGDLENTDINLSLSFEYLLKDYEGKIKVKEYESPFSVGESMDFHNAFFMGINDRKLAEFVDDVSKSIKAMQNPLKILSFGLDYRKYIKYDSIVKAAIVFVMSGEHVVYAGKNVNINPGEFEYCRDFIIESALKLQETNYEK